MLDNIIIQLKLRTVWSWPGKNLVFRAEIVTLGHRRKTAHFATILYGRFITTPISFYWKTGRFCIVILRHF